MGLSRTYDDTYCTTSTVWYDFLKTDISQMDNWIEVHVSVQLYPYKWSLGGESED